MVLKIKLLTGPSPNLWTVVDCRQKLCIYKNEKKQFFFNEKEQILRVRLVGESTRIEQICRYLEKRYPLLQYEDAVSARLSLVAW